MTDKNAVTKRCVYILDYLNKIPGDQQTELRKDIEDFLQKLNSLDSNEISTRMHKIEREFREIMLRSSVTAG